MSLQVDVQNALAEDSQFSIPGNDKIQEWANRAIEHDRQLHEKDMQMTVRIVSEEEIAQLNSQYRHKDNATNVLSFPFVPPPGVPRDVLTDSLGDLVICASVVNREAEEQEKPMTAHWAHMVVHGTLHLLGYDHEDEEQANDMESLETAVLAELGFEDPYN
jgi:probable rRNA maturation factor